MLKYTETVLQKVSFNKELFGKELHKSVKWLRKEELNLLKVWCVVNFGAIYMDIIVEAFK